MMQLLFTAYLLLTFILKHRPHPQLNPERSPVLYLSATIHERHANMFNWIELKLQTQLQRLTIATKSHFVELVDYAV